MINRIICWFMGHTTYYLGNDGKIRCLRCKTVENGTGPWESTL